MIGPALFIVLAFIASLTVLAIVRALTAPPRPEPVHPGAARPCAVYEIDTQGGRKYIGYGFNPHQRIMQSHRRAKWWPRTLTAAATLEPDRVDWYRTEDEAHAEEIRRIRAARPGTLENRVLYKSGAAQ
jgi:hypothetical protein